MAYPTTTTSRRCTAGGLLVLGALLLAGDTPAAVPDAAEAGFTSVNELTIAAPCANVWEELVAIRRWWQDDHTFWGDAANLSLDPHLGGYFAERKPDGTGEVRHLEVIWVEPGRRLRLRGGLGPLQEHAVSAVLTITLAPVATDGSPDGARNDGACRLIVKYAVGGYVPGGLAAWAPVVDGVLRQQFTRLQTLVETGSPDAPGGR